MSDAGDERVNMVEDLVAGLNWDRAPLSLAHELRQMLKTIADQGTEIDSGGGDGCADLWVISAGRRILYHNPPLKCTTHEQRQTNS